MYVFGKQTIRELARDFQKDRRTVASLLSSYIPKKKEHDPRPVHIIADATYFGERTESTSWCVVVARDEATQENLWWTFCNSETTSVYLQMRNELTDLGYTILSVTGDGFGGLREAFSKILYQMCQVHMERLVTKGTTRKPQLDAGIALLALVQLVPKTNSHDFRTYLKKYIERYRDFLNEKTINPITGETPWTHEPLRKAALSLVRFEPFLFTHEHNQNIPKTTNSLEGHFRHINEVVAVHCGLTRPHKERVIHTILLAGTIAPSEEKLREIL